MRTTLDIEDDVLFAAKETARAQKRTAGEVISEWARATLTRPSAAGASNTADPADAEREAGLAKLRALGIHPLPRRPGVVVTNEIVNRIRDEEGI
jgi:hypothetical protein